MNQTLITAVTVSLLCCGFCFMYCDKFSMLVSALRRGSDQILLRLDNTLLFYCAVIGTIISSGCTQCSVWTVSPN